MLCFIYAYVDMAYSRWDIATEVYEMVNLFLKLAIFLRSHQFDYG